MPNDTSFLNKAKSVKNDEFYTTYDYIDIEVKHYKDSFKDKIIYCPCDDYRISNFPLYFKNNFSNFGLKKVIASCYSPNGKGTLYIFDGEKEIAKEMFSNGDFLGEEVKSIMKQTDIIVTNPPFSLLQKFYKLLKTLNKDFLMVSPMAFIPTSRFDDIATYKTILHRQSYKRYYFINSNDIRNLTQSDLKEMSKNPKYGIFSTGTLCWLTNLINDFNNPLNRPFLKTIDSFDESYYKRYDKPNDDILIIPSIKEIPKNYKGVMALPLTILLKINPKQFENS